jgi:uncharacterized membrane protein YczE
MTESNIEKHVVLMVDEEIVFAPVITGPIRNGTIVFEINDGKVMGIVRDALLRIPQP